jgi:hypothetical protein
MKKLRKEIGIEKGIHFLLNLTLNIFKDPCYIGALFLKKMAFLMKTNLCHKTGEHVGMLSKNRHFFCEDFSDFITLVPGSLSTSSGFVQPHDPFRPVRLDVEAGGL